MVICAPQTFLGDPSLTGIDVFWIQVEYWTVWAIISPLIFLLCRRLYEGPQVWGRYVAGLLAGVVVVSLLHPLLGNLIAFSRMWVAWSLGLRPDQPTAFLAKVGLAILKNSGTNPFMFAVIAIAWLAMRHARDLREKQVRAIELESRLREAQLQALRSQLNPHFLFNTLHSIAELVHENPHLAEQLILRLGELLRKVLASSGRPEVALAEEIEFIKAYLDIEQMRLGDRLRVEWDIAPDALAVQVPSLVLQPLVENAIQHGIASLNRPGELRIRARRDNGYLDLQVRDSGPGLQPRGDAANPGIGLANTEARLRALFGERYHFELINDSGLSVNLRLPAGAPAT
jgi:signal transduction histidine kinase